MLFNKRINKKNKLISFFTILLIISSFIYMSTVKEEVVSLDAPLIREVSRLTDEQAIPVQSFTVEDPKKVQVVLARVYLDGEVSEEIIEETIWSMEDFWAEYNEWDLVDQDEAKVVFQKNVDDISPLLKINGYFGISEDGILNIYEGNPSEQKVIQSFFQINTKQLKSHQQKELQNGIPVLSRDRYEEVLKTYQKYAKQEM